MRLWHQDLIPLLPRQQLLGQHRECCALRGKGWGKQHATVDYVFKYSPLRLYEYHQIVMNEMAKRGYKPNTIWYNANYRGKSLAPLNHLDYLLSYSGQIGIPIYPEHNHNYLNECIENLKSKGVILGA